MKKICEKCGSKFNFEDPKYQYCPYCGIVLKAYYTYRKKPVYNPSKRNASEVEKTIELKSSPMTDESPIIKELKAHQKALQIIRKMQISLMQKRAQMEEKKYHGN